MDHDVHARLVTAGSVLVGSSLINVDNTGGTYDKFPSVSNSDGVPSALTQEWNISWQREYNSTDWDIRGAQIHWQGTLTTPSFSLDFASNDDRYSASSSPLNYRGAGARNWMAAYQRRSFSGPLQIHARGLKGGLVVASETISDLFPLANGQDKFAPDIDSNGQHFFVVWSELYSSSTVDKDVYGGTFYMADAVSVTFY